jgi:hypothetical protein
VTSQAALVNIQRVGNDCARPEVTGDGLDTAEVWGSSPDAPTNFFNNLATRTTTFLEPYKDGTKPTIRFPLNK